MGKNAISMRGLPKAPSRPKPFSRPSIDLGEPAVKREWREAPVEEISEGDIVRDAGLVVAIWTAPYKASFRFKFQNGSTAIFHPGTTLFAFTAVKNA